jgi:hypothetical protein
MPDGSVKHLHVSARALKTSSGDLEYVGAVTDVTAAKQRVKRCGGARVIWPKRRGSRTQGVGPGACQDGIPYISPRSGIAYMALTQHTACQLGKIGCSVSIPRIEPKCSRQKIEQPVKSRITKWITESFFRMALLNTPTQSAILF